MPLDGVTDDVVDLVLSHRGGNLSRQVEDPGMVPAQQGGVEADVGEWAEHITWLGSGRFEY